MKPVLLGLAMLLSPFVDQTPALAQGEPAYVIENSSVTQVVAANGHSYRLMIAWPDGAPPAAGWPVLYLLDGADHFATAAEAARRLARAGARSGISAGLIVAIDSGPLAQRVLDYTPATPGWAIPQGAPAAGLATGGGEAFLDFVATRVQPMVAKRWRVDGTRRTLAGHSFGGLLALHAMFTRPGLFDNYAAVSPSLWFGGDLMAQEAARFAPVAGKPAALLVTTGGDERSPDGAAGAAAEALTARLAAKGVNAWHLDLVGQSHGTTMLASMGQTIALAFGSEGKR